MSGDGPFACAWCGTVAAGGSPPLDWVGDVVDGGGARYYCAACAREHLRSIEARLDQEWW